MDRSQRSTPRCIKAHHRYTRQAKFHLGVPRPSEPSSKALSLGSDITEFPLSGFKGLRTDLLLIAQDQSVVARVLDFRDSPAQDWGEYSLDKLMSNAKRTGMTPSILTPHQVSSIIVCILY